MEKGAASRDDPGAFIAAMERMGMDAGYMTSREARHVLAVSGGIPKNFVSPRKTPRTEILERNTPQGLRRVGLVFFPELAPDAESQKERELAVIAAGKELMKQTDLVIGASLWGEARDSSFLFLAAGAFDLILSCGPGDIYELKQRPDAPGIALLRPVDRGIAIPYLDLFEWPDRVGRKNAALNLQLNIEPLGDDVPEDQNIAGLISRMSGEFPDFGRSSEKSPAEELSLSPGEDIFSPAEPVNNCR